MMTTLREQLIEFHTAVDQPVLEVPTVPDDKRVRLRAALIAEEFLETLQAMFDDNSIVDPAFTKTGEMWRKIKAQLHFIIERADVVVDLEAVIDGLADIDYVVEGTRLEFGVDGAPIAAEVHRTNMLKTTGEIAPNGKRLKPPGLKPPDIAGELEKQGWKP